MKNDEMKAVYAAIEKCSWQEADKIATAFHILSARLINSDSPRHIHLEFNAFAIRAEIRRWEERRLVDAAKRADK